MVHRQRGDDRRDARPDRRPQHLQQGQRRLGEGRRRPPRPVRASYPFGAYKAVRETIYTDYAINESHDGHNFGFDLAQLRLATPVQAGVGRLGQEIRDDAYFRTASVTTSGYPGDLPAGSPYKGDVMYTASGRTTIASSHIVHYSIPTARGQSGSPIYRTDASGTYINSIVSYGLPVEADPSYNNGAVRITPAVAADLKTWGIVDSVANPSVVFAHAVLPHDRSTFRVTTAFTPQGLMHVLPG